MLADWIRRRFALIGVGLITLCASVGTTFIVINGVAGQATRNGALGECLVSIKANETPGRPLTTDELFALCPQVDNIRTLADRVINPPTTTPASTTATVPAATTVTRAATRPTVRTVRRTTTTPAAPPQPTTTTTRPPATSTTVACVGGTAGGVCVTLPPRPEAP